jgi:N6-L-threonylcarbamoyladenine synthase
VAVHAGPGLIGSLLVGVQAAKGIAFVHGKPWCPSTTSPATSRPRSWPTARSRCPALALVVSGGHTSLFEVPSRGDYRLRGRTRDDAAGEAFDKVARLLGLGYPGGPSSIASPRAPTTARSSSRWRRIKGGSRDFSFSGIKTAVLYHVRREGIAPVADPRANVPTEVRDLVAVVPARGRPRRWCGA